jgi:hypothetical protein
MTQLMLLLASVGLGLILSEGAILSRPRNFLRDRGPDWLSEMSTCGQCMGFWSGVIVELSAGLLCDLTMLPGAHLAFSCLVAGWSSSALCVTVLGVRR